jgi:hypothetical protein
VGLHRGANGHPGLLGQDTDIDILFPSLGTVKLSSSHAWWGPDAKDSLCPRLYHVEAAGQEIWPETSNSCKIPSWGFREEGGKPQEVRRHCFSSLKQRNRPGLSFKILLSFKVWRFWGMVSREYQVLSNSMTHFCNGQDPLEALLKPKAVGPHRSEFLTQKSWVGPKNLNF